ncbi:MAG TPA: hypothetical protein VMI10_15395 [Terriglobales bacterium]|nr:hypothetical protein [Terriglobales bacterium]
MSRAHTAVLIPLLVALAAIAGPKLVSTDPMTGLPLYPATASRLHLGNDPTVLPDSMVCKSKMQADFYSVYDSKVSAVLTWYSARLSGFKKTHAYAANRSQDTFYKSDGTMAVSVTGGPGKDGEDTPAYSVVYSRFNPGLSERVVITLNQQKVVCP